MEHNNIVIIEDENMISGDICSSVCIEFDMPDVEIFTDEVDLSQPMYVQEEDTTNDTCLVPLRALMDIDDMATQHVPPTKTGSLTVTSGSPKEKVRERKMRGPYRRYTAHQIEQLFDYVIEQGKTAKDAALLTGINIRTAQNYIKGYNDDEERRLPINGRKLGAGRKPKLTEVHSQFLIGYVDEHPTAILTDIRRNLCDAFTGLTISISALHRHLVEKCKLTLKKLEKLPAVRNSDRMLKLRREKIEEWEAIPELDYAKNCVFIDEAGFNLHTQRNYGRSRKGTPAKGIVPTAKGITVTILGAISQAGVIDISLSKPQAVSMSKKRKTNGAKAMSVSGRVGTRTEHFLAYISNVMDVLG